MKPKMTTTLALALAAAVLGSASWAQEPPAQTPPPAPSPDAPSPVAEAPPAPESGWKPLSRSSDRVYLVDMSKVRREGDVTAVPVARTRLNRVDADDFSYTIDEIELKCASGVSRATTTVDYDSDDAETDRYEDPTAWAPILPETLDDYVRSITCEDNVLTSRSWPTIHAFIAAGQPVSAN